MNIRILNTISLGHRQMLSNLPQQKMFKLSLLQMDFTYKQFILSFIQL